MSKLMSQNEVANDFRNAMRKILNFVWPSSSSRVPFREGFVRGLLTAFASLALLVIPITISLSAAGVISSIDDAFQLALVLVLGATGAFVNVSTGIPGFDFAGATSASVGLHPTLLTIALIWVALVLGRRFGRSNSDGDAQRFHAFGVGLGFAIPLLVAGLASYGLNSIGENNPVSLLGPTALDALLMFLIVALPSWIGSRSSAVRPAVTVWTWASASLLRFALSYAALASLALLTFIVVSWIEPDFVHSTPTAQIDLGLGWGESALLVVGILLFLPTALASALMVSMGTTTGLVLSPNEGSFAFDQVLQSLNSGLTGLPEVSALSVLGWWSYPVIGVFVVAVAAISGVSSAKKLDYMPKKLSDVLAIAVFYGAVAFVIQHFVSVQFSWLAKSVGIDGSVADASLTVTGQGSFGVTLITILLLAAVVASSVYFTTGYAKNFVRGAFPRSIDFLSGAKDKAARGSLATIFGRAFSLIVVLMVVIPLGIGTTERVWGSIDSPLLIGEDLAVMIAAGDVTSLKAYYDKGVVGADEWIADAIMADALPKADNKPQIQLFNESGEGWNVGNTDSVIHLKWSMGDAGELDWAVPATSEVERVWNLIDHADYKSALTPARVNFELSEYLLGADESSLKINGASVEAGTYALLPGVYRLVAPAFKLLAATDVAIIVNSGNRRVLVGDEIAIPAGGDEKIKTGLQAATKRCAKINAKGASKCFSAAEVVEKAEVVSGIPPTKFFSKNNVRFAAGSSSCSEDSEDKLKTASSMTRTVQCEQVVTYVQEYHKVRKVRIPIQSCDIDWDAWWEDPYSDDPYDYEYCWTSGYRTNEVEGAVIASVKYSATIQFSVTVTGTLDAKENFTVN